MCECAECECECRFYTVRGEHSISVVKMCLQIIDCGTRVGNKSINRKAGPSEVCRGDLSVKGLSDTTPTAIGQQST